jgi:hypothetical protein
LHEGVDWVVDQKSLQRAVEDFGTRPQSAEQNNRAQREQKTGRSLGGNDANTASAALTAILAKRITTMANFSARCSQPSGHNFLAVPLGFIE